jgi:class 3 adenylate cyclase
MDFEEKQRQRYQLLSKLYELTDGSSRRRANVDQLLKEAGINRANFYHVLQYLIDEGLALKSNLVVNITHAGIVEFEASQNRPDQPTDHFSSQVIQHFHGPVGSVQTTTDASSNIGQQILQVTPLAHENPSEPADFTFVDWCSRVLDLLIEESDKDVYARTEGVDEYQLFPLLFDMDAIPNFHESPQRRGALEALEQLAKLGLVEQVDSHFWKVTLTGREAAAKIERFWDDFSLVRLQPDEEKILKATAKLGEKRASDHAWIESVHHSKLLPELGETELMDMLWGVSADVEARGFVEREALAGPHLDLKPTYRGLVWIKERDAIEQPEMGHVLFLDIVGYSKLAMEEQARAVGQLERIVKNTKTFREAKHHKNLISLTTGDGMALVFFGGVLQHFDCAIEITKALSGTQNLPLRIGINTGPVYRRVDINTNRNVAGGGINIAQRVMDCGDAGHILLAKSAADLLTQLDYLTDNLHELGEAEVKHGVKVHLFSFHNDTIGNSSIPQKLRRQE